MGDSKLWKTRENYKEEIKKLYKEDGVDASKVALIKDFAKTVYYLGEICKQDMEFEEEPSEGFSFQRSMTGGNSYRGRTRDSMGRFSGNGSYYSGTGYSGNQNGMSYDEAKDVMTHRLGDLMMCTKDQFVQSVLSDALQRIQNH